MKKLIIIFVLLALLMGVSSTVFAAKPEGNQAELHDALVLGANLHLERQGTYANACGGGYGPPDVDEIANTWEWVIGSNYTCWNVGGISAIGLLGAYEKTRDNDYLDAALLTGDTLIWRYNNITADGADWEDRPFSQDIEFLVCLSKDSKDESYANVAADWYHILVSGMNATENADRYIDNRKSLAGWDLASQIRAAAEAGYPKYAAGMAARLIERRDDWENVLYGSWNYTMSSYASLLWAFDKIGETPYRDYVNEITEILLDAQGADGSWDSGDYQTTAYAILGLSQPHTPVRANAVAKAWHFLRDSQTEEGGWSYPGEYGEVNSEVLLALASIQLDEGMKKGHTDPNADKGNDLGKHPLDPAL